MNREFENELIKRMQTKVQGLSNNASKEEFENYLTNLTINTAETYGKAPKTDLFGKLSGEPSKYEYQPSELHYREKVMAIYGELAYKKKMMELNILREDVDWEEAYMIYRDLI
jgi:hypothetical protein